jgi:hypothetical protein
MRANHHAVIFAAGLLAASLWVSAARASDLTVTATTGQVTVIEHGRSSAPSVGAKLTLPVEIHTGADGALDLQQLGSALHVGPNSTVAVPEPAAPGNVVDKIRQTAGYVLYNIKSRKDHPLAVETPYLVSVVKGTVFTIAVEEHASTVALMEGSLEISAPGVPEHVLLEPNQSIRHAQGESQLSVRSSASASVSPRGEQRVAAPSVLPEAMQSGQMAQVAKDLADAGAAVAAGHAIATHQAAQSSGRSAPGTNTSGGGRTSSPGTASSGSGGSNPGAPGTSGPSNGGGSSVSTGGTVTLPPTASDGSTNGTGNCNGKNNGTGSGNCYGHQSGRASKQ